MHEVTREAGRIALKCLMKHEVPTSPFFSYIMSCSIWGYSGGRWDHANM